MLNSKSLAESCLGVFSGCDVDYDAIKNSGLDAPTLRRMAEAYRSGWLNNVMGRITPLTVSRQGEYLTMADIFIDTPDYAQHLLDKYQADIELFCHSAGIIITEHMTAETVSDELQAHVNLYNAVSSIFEKKFNTEYVDPVQEMATAPLDDMCNPFIRDFMDEKFPERKRG